MRHSRASRVARALLAASAATFVALLSHVSAGGAVPGWVGVVVPWALSTVVCLALAGRRLSLPRLTIAVGLSQLLFHALFVLGTFAPSTGGAAGHVHVAGTLMISSAPDAVAPALGADALMWVWHAFAAIVTVAALHRGESAIVGLSRLAGELVRWLRRRIVAALALPRPASARRILATVLVDLPALCASSLSALPRRGPPLARAV